jgi:hypothetical protein
MSEYSESYHLRSNNLSDGVDLLKRAGLMGYVFPPSNNWIAMVIPTEELSSSEDNNNLSKEEMIAKYANLRNSDAFLNHSKLLVTANDGLLLHYVWQEDHNWSFEFFNKSELVSGYLCDWNSDEFIVDDSQLNVAFVQSLLVKRDNIPHADAQRILYPQDFETLWNEHSGYIFAIALGLSPFSWLSYHLVSNHPSHWEKDFPGLIEVGE